MRLMNSAVCKSNVRLTRNISTAFQGQLEETLMSQALCHLAVNVAVPVRLKAQAPQAGSSRCLCVLLSSMRKHGWHGHLTEQGSSFGFREPSFAGIARMHLLWGSRVPEMRACHVVDELHSLERMQ